MANGQHSAFDLRFETHLKRRPLHSDLRRLLERIVMKAMGTARIITGHQSGTTYTLFLAAG
ncbi:MAG: hypothetical protein IPK83_01735 [Planctomycetes bacterium]|nr:hypothetical protein [Planctomycetota bacterium]